MKIIGLFLILIGVIVGYIAYVIDINPATWQIIKESANEILQKNIADRQLYIITAGFIFIAGIILVSRNNPTK